jgi:hypothetical protein
MVLAQAVRNQAMTMSKQSSDDWRFVLWRACLQHDSTPLTVSAFCVVKLMPIVGESTSR